MNFALGLFWLVLLVDWLTFIILLFVGIILGFFVFVLLGNYSLSTIITQDFSVIFLALYMYIYAIILGLIFSRKRMLTEQLRQDTLKSMAGAIAHEMRTPLANVSMSGHVIKRQLEKLKQQLTTSGQKETFQSSHLETLEQTADNLINTSKRSQNLINVLLTNLKQELDTLPQSILSMEKVLKEALKEFAYHPHEEEKVHYVIDSDFYFKGDQEIVIHILFNLLKNSLYFIHACGKGEIFIAVKKGDNGNILLFKDTGPGIEKERLPRLFTPFYSRRPHGTGIGLSFCKRAIESMGGTIQVSSILGEHTTFTLTIPPLKENISL